MIFLIIIGTIVGFIFWRKHKKKLERTKTRRTYTPQPHTTSTGSVKPFIWSSGTVARYVEEIRAIRLAGNMGDIIVSPLSAGGRVEGAFANVTPDILRRRSRAIKNGEFERSDEERKNANVPGFKRLNVEGMKMYPKATKPLWHRTHLLPFRFALSDGKDIPNLMFAGTAHLNHGDRPQLNYFVSNDEAEQRGKELFDRYVEVGWHIGLAEDEEITVRRKGVPRDTHYSLDDIERLCSHIILSDKNPNARYRYAVTPLYHPNNNTRVPDEVMVSLVNLDRLKSVLYAKIPNVF